MWIAKTAILLGLIFSNFASFGFAQSGRSEARLELHPFMGYFANAGGKQSFFESPPGATIPYFIGQAANDGFWTGIRAGYDVWGPLSAEGGFSASAAGKAGSLTSTTDARVLRDFFLVEGSTWMLDATARVNLPSFWRLTPFLTVGGGVLTSTSMLSKDSFISAVQSPDRRQLFPKANEFLSEASHDRFLQLGAGGKLWMGNSWGVRFELRNRVVFGPPGLPTATPVFLDVTLGPFFHF